MAVLPEEIPTGTLKGQFYFVNEDSIDPDTNPELTVVQGFVRCIASVKSLRMASKKAIVIPLRFDAKFDGQGNLVPANGTGVGMEMPAVDSPLFDTTGWYYTAHFELVEVETGFTVNLKPIEFQIFEGQDTDLSDVIPIEKSPGVITTRGIQGIQGVPGVDGSNVIPTAEAVAYEIGTPGTLAHTELTATFVQSDKTAINVLQAGASSARTATENTAIIQGVFNQAATEGRAVYIPSVYPPIKINDALVAAGPGLTVFGDGPMVAIEQTAYPKPFIDAGTYAGVSVENVGAMNSAVRVSNMTTFRGNTLKNYSAFVYSNASDVTVRNCLSQSFNAGVFNLGLDLARLRNFTVDGFEFHDGEFGVFCDRVDGVQVRNVWGDYSYSQGGSQAPHLLYIGAWSDSAMTDVLIENLRAFNSTGSYAFQFKGLVGATVRNLYSDGCAGILAFDALSDVLIDGVTSLNDVYPITGAEASLCNVSLDPMDNVTIRNVNIELVNDAKGIQFLSGTKCKLENATVRVAHTTTSTASYDINVRGEWELIRPRVINTGAKAWDGIFVFNGSGAVIRDPETVGARIPVRISGTTSNARIYYDPEKLGRHATDGLHPVDLNVADANNKAIPNNSPSTRYGRRNLGSSRFDVAASSNSAAGVLETGQFLTQVAGAWHVTDGYVRNIQGAVGALWANFNSPDVEMFADMLYEDANGLAFRGLDANNYLFVRIRQTTLGVELRKREAGVETELMPPYALTPHAAPGRRYRLGVRMFGNDLEVVLDGIVIMRHTLSAADMTAFGANTRHGFRSHTTSAKFTDFVVNSLR